MNDPRGSMWRKWDLHFHTPKSHDHGNKGMSAAEVVHRLVQAKVEVVAVTDHHVLDREFIAEIRKAAGDAIAILPGIELASNLGGNEGVHFIAVFSEDSDLLNLERELLTRLDINRKRTDGVKEERLYVEFPAAAEVIQQLDGIITIHGHGKAANYETISSSLKFKQEQKTDLLRDYVDIIEVGGLDHCRPYREIIFPQIGFTRPLIIGSDDHCRKDYPLDKCCWIKADPTFAGLKMALREPEHRFCLDAMPPDVDRVAKNKTKYIKSVSFEKLATMPHGEEWLHGEVPLNSGLVAVIGNKGSGKSALSDCIGLLGSCATSGAFSFLEENRFRHPKTGRAEHVQATMSWHDGDPVRRTLDEPVSPDEPERLKYLPQNFVEQVCNDLASPNGGTFEQELKKVVFSKVPEVDRLDKRTLDDLVEYRTEELRDEADSLAQELSDLGERRSRLEERLDPSVKTGLEKQIERKEEEIKSHESTKPEEREPPPTEPTDDSDASKSIEELEQLKTERETVIADIETQNEIIKVRQLRVSTSDKLLGKLENLKTTVQRSVDDMSPEADAIGLKPEDLALLTIKDEPVKTIRDDAAKQRDAARDEIGSAESERPTGLEGQRRAIDARIKELQDQLSKPHQEYQEYLEAKKKWDAALKKLKGTKKAPDSLSGLEADLKALDAVPEKITEIEAKQVGIAERIHGLRVKEAEVYSELYAPVQKFITEHPLASEHLKLEFKVEVVEAGFADNLLSFVNQNRVGSFYGVEDGQRAAKNLVARVEWSDWNAVKQLLQSVVHHLHHDKRDGGADKEVLLSSQVGKGKTAAELYGWLYGLEYLSPRYLLRWDGKDVEQLSPGERGTLLLIFYLLVDDSDVPLVIDQPETNLDNVTVAQKLVHCIRDARSRRQVIIVTHNPNLAVVCDADQIVHASLDKPAGNRIRYETGALERPEMNQFTINVLEGGRDPFDIRDDTYKVIGE